MDEQEKKQTGKGVLVIGIVAIVVVAVLVGVIVFLLKSQNKPEEKKQVVVTEDNVEDVVSEITDHSNDVEDGYYTVTMNYEWHFKHGDEASYDSYVKNVEGNTNDVYFDIVMRDDESQVLYSSPVIARGAELKDIKLDKELEAGTYSTVCIYYLVDEDQNALSEVRMGLTLIVED